MEDNRTRYKGICPECGKYLLVCKSVAMVELGVNIGQGPCDYCKAFLNFEFNKERKEFDVRKCEL